MIEADMKPIAIEPVLQQPPKEIAKGSIAATAVKAFQAKAAEAEDILRKPPKPVLRRHDSFHTTKCVSTQIPEQKAIAQKQAHLWTCLGRRPDLYGGYIYQFQLKDEFYGDPYAASSIVEEIFPAVEPQGIASMDTTLLALGYNSSDSGSKLTYDLPDLEALKARYEKLRESNPQLPPLDINSSEGIADDLSFIQAYFTHDLLLSSGEEFLHDQTMHLIPTLTLMTSTKKYTKMKATMLNLIIKTAYQKYVIAKNIVENGFPYDQLPPENFVEEKERIYQMIESFKGTNLEKVGTAISLYIDTLWTTRYDFFLQQEIDDMNYSKKEKFLGVIHPYAYLDFWRKKFDFRCQHNDLFWPWEKMTALVEKYMAVRKLNPS